MCVCLNVSACTNVSLIRDRNEKAQNKLHVHEHCCLNRKSNSGGFRRKKAWIINWRNYAKISSRLFTAASVVKRQTKINFNEGEGEKKTASNPFRKISKTKILAPFLCAFTFSETKLCWRQDWSTLGACAADINKIEQNLSEMRLEFEQCRLMNIFMRKVENSCFTRTHNERYAWWTPEKVTVLWKVVVFSFKNFHTPASRRDESTSPRELSPCSPEIWFEWVITFPSHAGSGSERKWRKGNGNVLTGGYQGNVSLAQKTPKIRKNEHRVLSRLWRKF